MSNVSYEAVYSLKDVEENIKSFNTAEGEFREKSTDAGRAGIVYGLMGLLALAFPPVSALAGIIYGITVGTASVGAGVMADMWDTIEDSLSSGVKVFEDIEDIFQTTSFTYAKVRLTGRLEEIDGKDVLIPSEFQLLALSKDGYGGWVTAI